MNTSSSIFCGPRVLPFLILLCSLRLGSGAESSFPYFRQAFISGITLPNPYTSHWSQERDGMFYATYRSGMGGSAVYRMRSDGGEFTLIRRESSNYLTGTTMGLDGRLYGSTWQPPFGAAPGLFRMNADGGMFEIIKSLPGEHSVAGVVQDADGMLFGTTVASGNFNRGVVFKVTTNGTGFERIHHFGSVPADGHLAGALLIGSDGWLYGCTVYGGDRDQGIIFKINRDGGGYAVLHHFDNTSRRGGRPTYHRPLLEASDGLLYGAADGGDNRAGVLFCIGRDGSGFRLVHQFAGEDSFGDSPVGGLIEWCDGALYGTTHEGGIDGAGIVFRVNRDGSGFRVLKVYIDGPNPGDSDGTSGVPLVLGADGRIHGLTSGGSVAQGTKFMIDIAPAIAMRMEPSVVTLSWPSCADGFVLEYATALAQPTEWSPVTVEPADSGTRRLVQLPRASAPFFFRLVRR